jgi:AAA+ ATPase superfamily predicted ATPase
MNERQGRRIGRPREEAQIIKYLQATTGSGLVYLRGRRRIGKSELLEYVGQRIPGCFYFTGIRDETRRLTLRRFADAWAEYSGSVLLAQSDTGRLNWQFLFEQIEDFARSKPQQPINILIDEIQWLAKAQSGFVGHLKLAWQHLERFGNVKFIICGSSNKFFSDNVGGEEKILRGLRTHADIWVRPFSLESVWNNWGADWSLAEATFIYFCLGGVPYYLNMLPRQQGYIASLNQAAFVASSPLLTEVDEVLRLEFNRRSLPTIKRIVSTLGMSGRSEKEIALAARLAQSTTSESLDKLVEYGLVYPQTIFGKVSQRDRGMRYELRDPYLNFYFNVLVKYSRAISANTTRLILADLLPQAPSLYLPNFTGRSFELLVRGCLENDLEQELQLTKGLGLGHGEIEYSSYFSTDQQIDLVITDPATRTVHVIECKWTFDSALLKTDLTKLSGLKLQLPPGYALRKHIISPQTKTPTFERQAKDAAVNVWDLTGLCRGR